MPKIGVEDVKRLFTEINSQDDAHDSFWTKEFTDEGYIYMANTVSEIFPSILQETTKRGGHPIHSITAFYLGGVMLGWNLRDQYGRKET